VIIFTIRSHTKIVIKILIKTMFIFSAKIDFENNVIAWCVCFHLFDQSLHSMLSHD